MQPIPLRSTVIGSYPFPGWLEFAARHLGEFGADDLRELQDDAVIAAVHDQVQAGLDVLTDGEQTRLDFNLSFYGYIEGLELEGASPRRFGPPAHDQRGKHMQLDRHPGLRSPRRAARQGRRRVRQARVPRPERPRGQGRKSEDSALLSNPTNQARGIE